MSATPAHRVSTGERINHELPGHLERELGARGIRLTRQRRVLLQVMDTARRHLDADEILQRDHIHVACIRCGKVREFESELYEQLKSQISRDCGIEITVTRTEVGGLCADCRKPR